MAISNQVDTELKLSAVREYLSESIKETGRRNVFVPSVQHRSRLQKISAALENTAGEMGFVV